MFLWLIFILVLSFWFYKGTRKPLNFPPGPPRLPLLGSIPFMKGSGINGKMWNKELHNKYGSVVGLFMGNDPFIMINDPKVMVQALSREEFQGRIRDPLALAVRGENKKMFGILMTDGEQWKHQASFTFKTLKSLGIGKSVMEDAMVFEANMLTEYFAEYHGQDMFMEGQFNIPVLNVLWSVMANFRYDYKDPKAQEFMNTLRSLFRNVNFLRVLFGVLKYFPEFSGLNTREHSCRTIILGIHLVDNMMIAFYTRSQSLTEVKSLKLEENGVVAENFISKYLHEMKTNPHLNEKELLNIVLDFLAAGSETVSSTMMFALQYLAHDPDIQEKLLDEIKELKDQSIEISLVNQHRFSLIQATIYEVFRKSSLTASVIPHRVTKDTTLNGFDIPKDATVLTNNIGNNSDPEYFQAPDEFDPFRFLDCQGKCKMGEVLAPFGLGKRTCPGEALARGELFIFLTTLLQKFKFELPLQHDPPSGEVIWGLARVPAPYWIRLVPRVD